MKIKFLDLQKQYKSLEQQIDNAIKEVLHTASYIKGEAVNLFEKKFAEYCNNNFCISCGNGTDALTVLIKCLNLKKGSCIIVPANTFIATAEAVVQNGFNIKFADVDDDYTLSLENVENIMTEDVSAIIAVHLYGQPAKMKELRVIADKWNVPLLEDCAQAHGALLENKKVGSLADGAVFSFYPGKVLGAYGDAGAIVVKDKELEEKIRKYCDHGRTEKYKHEICGINSRMDSIQAAVLNVKLKYLDEWILKRNAIANKYFEMLSGIEGLILPVERKNVRHSWHLFIIRHPRRNDLALHLKENGIETGIHYPLSLPEQPVFKDHLFYAKDFRAVKYSSELLSLPMGEHLNDEELNFIAKVIRNFK